MHGRPPDADSDASILELAEEAIGLAADLLVASRRHETAADRGYESRMARLVGDAAGKRFTIAMADEVLRIRDPARAARRLEDLVDRLGTPRSFPRTDRALLHAAAWAGRLLPDVVIPQVRSRVRRDAAHVIVSAEDGPFVHHVERRRREGFGVNVNRLGEAILGEPEAARRLALCQESIRDPRVDYVSVKLSSIASQISLVGYGATVDLLAARLATVYRAAIEARPERPKFVNLDMEEYRDLWLTVDIFRRVLDEPEFLALEAGIVLQAYLPDSAAMQRELTRWAIDRKRRGGAGIKLRLVKGANLAMEKVEAAARGWPQAPYDTKLEADANFKRMLAYGCRPEHASAVRLGVASHNLFDIALALLLRRRCGGGERVEFEMLEGMANGQAAELRDRAGSLLLYTPVVLDREFESAVAYLVRRLDENTAPGSFLASLFSLEPGSPAWEAQAEAFADACRLAEDPALATTPRRTQDRRQPVEPPPVGLPFSNAPDTDFSLPANRAWIEEVVRRHAPFGRELPPPTVRPSIAEGAIDPRRGPVDGRDPSRPGTVPYRYEVGSHDDVERAVAAAEAAARRWAALPIAERTAILRACAVTFERHRGDTIGAMLLDGGKAVAEADAEVSEAVDFAAYYARSLDDPLWHDGTAATPLGVVVVAPPWNFPFAIPAGGCLAALAAGNAAILKPAPETVLVASRLADQLHEAGVPRDVLQFLPLEDGPEGRRLIAHPRVAAVVLTGGWPTARLFRSWRPDMTLLAETSGKNAIVITAAADLDLAVRDLVRSGFGHAGQKCSAASLAIVEASVYDDPAFRETLRAAAASLVVDSAWNLSASVTPLIRPPGADLLRGLTMLDDGESWLLEPREIGGNPCLWSPGIRLGVRPDGWFFRTECFGPVLGVVRARDLDEAIEMQNACLYGLTGGLHSLDESEIARWRDRVAVGNAYVNRATTGAIVRRQPFGGWKRSSVGPGAKAGGPNYVATLCRWRETALPARVAPPSRDVQNLVESLRTILVRHAAEKDIPRLERAAGSMALAWTSEFARGHDPSAVRGESNLFRYRPRPWVRVRTTTDASPDAVGLAVAAVAARTAGVPLAFSLVAACPTAVEIAGIAGCGCAVESEDGFIAELAALEPGGVVRVIGDAGAALRDAAFEAAAPLVTRPWLANGRIELLTLLLEQTVSETTHRYGNLSDAPPAGGRRTASPEGA